MHLDPRNYSTKMLFFQTGTRGGLENQQDRLGPLAVQSGALYNLPSLRFFSTA